MNLLRVGIFLAISDILQMRKLLFQIQLSHILGPKFYISLIKTVIGKGFGALSQKGFETL